MNKKIVIILSVLLVLLIMSRAVGQKLTLIAQEDIYIVKELKALDDFSSKNLIKILQKGERAEILDCVDIKSYIVPKISLPDGTAGFAVRGHFSLERRPAYYILQQQTSIFLFCPW